MGHKGPVLRPRYIELGRARNQTPFYSIQMVHVASKHVAGIEDCICTCQKCIFWCHKWKI